MSTIAARRRRSRRVRVPIIWFLLVATFLIAWLLVSLYGRGNFVATSTLLNIVERATALGIVAVGQTFTILVGSLDLSVAYLISVTAVMASFIMQGDPSRVPLALVVVTAIGLTVGLINGLLVTKARINPLIATLGMGLILRGLLNASFQNFAGAVSASFQLLAYGMLGPVPDPADPVRRRRWRPAHWSSPAPASAPTSTPWAATAPRPACRASAADRIVIGAHMVASFTAVLTGLYLASRLRSGAPWIGSDGVYDLESIAAVVVGGTVLSGGRGGVLGTIAGRADLRHPRRDVQPTRHRLLHQAGAARLHHHRRRRHLRLPLARGGGMSDARRPRRRPRLAHRPRQPSAGSPGVPGALLLIAWITYLNPSFIEPAFFLNFLRRSARR
jgi:ribose transport system permease protein